MRHIHERENSLPTQKRSVQLLPFPPPEFELPGTSLPDDLYGDFLPVHQHCRNGQREVQGALN